MQLTNIYLATLLLTLTAPMSLSASENTMETLTVIATRDQQAANRLANSVSLINKNEILTTSAQHISELLVRSPGTWVSRGNGQEHLTAIRSPVFTGAGSCGAFYIAEDGVSVRPTGFCNVNQLFDLNTEQAQRIEVLRGPGTEIHGSNALHGVINVVSQMPSEQPENSIKVELGPNQYNRIQYSGSNTLGNHGYRLSINNTYDGGYKNDSGFKQQKINLRHDFQENQLSITNAFSASNLKQETAGFVEGLDAYKDSSRKKENPNPEAFRDSESARFYSTIRMALSDKEQLIVTPYIRYSDMRFLMHFLPGDPIEENGQRSIGVQSAFKQIQSEQLTLSHGFDAEFTQAYLKQSQQNGFGLFPAGKQYDYEVDAMMLAGFINADYAFNPATRFTAGVRYELLQYDYDNRMIDGNTNDNGTPCMIVGSAVPCRYSRPEDRQDIFRNWSFNTSVLHQLNTSQDIVLRLARGFRAPQATELYRLQAGQVVSTIDSEKLDSIEVSLRDTRDTLNYSLTAFAMKKDNVIFQSSDRSNLDNGASKHYGIEYDFFWQMLSNWHFNITGTMARHIYTRDVSLLNASFSIKGNDIDTAPRNMASARLGWQASDTSYLELEWVHMGKYYTDIDNAHSYDGHDLLHLRITHQLSQQLRLGLRINNLTNQDYADRADFLITPFKQVDRYFIGEPRSAFINLSLTF